MPTPVAYKGPKDKADPSTRIRIRVDGEDHVFVKGSKPVDVSAAVAKACAAVKDHAFQIGKESGPSKDDLISRAKELNVSHSGTVAELEARIAEAEQAKVDQDGASS